MTGRKLTDELESVLRAHSLQAPAPSDTIARILAATVPDAIDAPAAAGTPTAARRWNSWRPGRGLVAAAAAAAVLVVGVAVLNSARNQQGRTAATSRPADQAGGKSALAESAASPGVPGAFGAAPPSAKPPFSGSPAGPGVSQPPTALPDGSLPGVPLAGGKACPQGEDVASTTGLQSAGAPLTHVRSSCASGDGSVPDVQLALVRGSGSDAVVRQILVPVTEKLHLDYLLVRDDHTVQVTGSWWGTLPDTGTTQPRPPRGSILTVTYRSSDGGGSFAPVVPAEVLAVPCRPADLGLAAVPVTSMPAGRAVRLQVENTTPTPCALEGTPTVTVTAAGATRLPARAGLVATPTGQGPAGGLHSTPNPPVIQLAPGAVATAVVESTGGSTAQACGVTDQLRISVRAVTLGTVAARVGICGLQVHPLMRGFTGSD
jgi:hypothetical protein